jgi:hypothetical protein
MGDPYRTGTHADDRDRERVFGKGYIPQIHSSSVRCVSSESHNRTHYQSNRFTIVSGDLTLVVSNGLPRLNS